MSSARDREHVHPADRAAWRVWLKDHHSTSPGCWLVTWKPATARPGVSYEEAILEGLCVGWVDSQSRSLDDERSALLFTPRRTGSPWAGTNKARIIELEAQGLLLPAGEAAIRAAKTDGSWEILDGPEAGVVPDDLAAALDGLPRAREVFDAFPPGVRKGMLTWIALAKRPDTRAKRVAEIASEAAEGRRAGEWGRA
jgi:uncharacterized protein YdeI (YjbR/CyaY-like superfamily)